MRSRDAYACTLMSIDGQNMISTQHGKVAFADAQLAALLKDHLDALCEPAPHGWQEVKRNPSRTVYRGQVGQQEFYLKHFHSQTLWHRIGRRLGIYPARREMQASRYLCAHGVNAMPVVAAMYGRTCQWVLSRAVQPAQPLNHWQAEQRELPAQQRAGVNNIVLELAELIGNMHRCGVVHHDLHAGNIMVQRDGQPGRLVLMDLHRSSRRCCLSRRTKASNLAQLLHDRYETTTRTQRLRFLRRYLQIAGGDGSLVGWERMIHTFALRHRRKIHTHSQKRILRHNRYFSPIKLLDGWRGHVMLAPRHTPEISSCAGHTFKLADWLAALTDIDGLPSGPDVQTVKDSPSGIVVRRRLNVGCRAVDVFIKRPRRKIRWKVLLDCFRPSRPLRAFELGHCLLIRGFLTALPLACLERRVGPILTDSILITEAVHGLQIDDFLNACLGRLASRNAHSDDSVSLRKGLPQCPPISADQRLQLGRGTLAEMGRLIRRLHDNNFVHRDLKETNMIVSWTQHGREIVLLDLDGLRHVRRVTSRRRFQGLMRLNVGLLKCAGVNHAGRLRMLLAYLRRPLGGSVAFKPYWRVLDQWSQRKLQQQIRSLRKKQKAIRRPE